MVASFRIFSGLLLSAVSQAVVYANSSDVDTPKSVDLDELNVVAIKQTDKLRDNPVSSTVVDRLELEMLNADAIKSISEVVPNLFIPEYGSRITSTIYVRGIGARMDQPSVGLTVDNVTFLNKNAYDFDLADIASVEMLRGPQSTLHGRNTIGGMINVTTPSPLRWQGWRAFVSGASGKEWKASLGWYGKVGKKWGTSVAGSFSYLGGFHRNRFNGKKVDKEMSGALRWKLEGSLNDVWSVRNTASASMLRQGGYPYESVETGLVNHNDTCFYRRFLWNDGLTFSGRYDRFTVSSITAVQYLDDNMTLDQDFLPDSYFTLTQKQKEWGLTEDIVFRGNEGGRYKWLAGCFGFCKCIDMVAPVTFGDKGIADLIEKHRNNANPYYPISWDTRSFVLGSDFLIPAGGVALYHESTFLAGRWQIVAGIRLDWEKSSLRYQSSCNTGYQIDELLPDGSLAPYRHVGVDIDDSGDLSRDYFNWLPKISALYTLPMDGQNNVYATIAKGYKSGGFNTQMFSDVLQQRLMSYMGIGERYDVDDIVGYKPESSWNCEVGAHLSFPGTSLDIDASLFYIDCHDQQLTMFPAGTTTGRMMTNAGRTRSFGGEFSADWSPIKNFSLKASYGYTNAKFSKFFNGIEDYKGKYVPYAPQNTLFVQGLYRFGFSGFVKSLTLEANVRGTGKIYWNESNSMSQPFYALAGASITAEGNHWSVEVWGRNLTGTCYDTFYFMSMGNEFLQRGRPLQAGVTLRFTI